MLRGLPPRRSRRPDIRGGRWRGCCWRRRSAQLGRIADAGRSWPKAESRHGLKSMLFAPELSLARAWTAAARRDGPGRDQRGARGGQRRRARRPVGGRASGAARRGSPRRWARCGRHRTARRRLRRRPAGPGLRAGPNPGDATAFDGSRRGVRRDRHDGRRRGRHCEGDVTAACNARRHQPERRIGVPG